VQPQSYHERRRQLVTPARMWSPINGLHGVTGCAEGVRARHRNQSRNSLEFAMNTPPVVCPLSRAVLSVALFLVLAAGRKSSWNLS
jgi:hypothetical protein